MEHLGHFSNENTLSSTAKQLRNVLGRKNKIGPLDCALYIKALLTCMPRFLANSFFALNSVLNTV